MISVYLLMYSHLEETILERAYNFDSIKKLFKNQGYELIRTYLNPHKLIKEIDASSQKLENRILIITCHADITSINIKYFKKIFMIKTSFCYDVYPTRGTLSGKKMFDKNFKFENVIWLDSGVTCNTKSQKYWKDANINYNIKPYHLLNYDLNKTMDYNEFCLKHNLNPKLKLAVWFPGAFWWLTKPFTNTHGIKEVYEADTYIFINFEEIKQHFKNNGYNLIIKEHRSSKKRIGPWLSEIDNDKEFTNYIKSGDKNILNKWLKKASNPLIFRRILEYINHYRVMSSHSIPNNFELEILKYADIGIFGSNTSIANILYAFDCKTLLIDNHENESWIKIIQDRQGLNYEINDINYGLTTNINYFKKNTNDIIKSIIEYNEPNKFKYNHPLYGNATLTHEEYFQGIIDIIKK